MTRLSEAPNPKALEAARDWLRKRWCVEHPNEGHVKQLAEYATYLASLPSPRAPDAWLCTNKDNGNSVLRFNPPDDTAANHRQWTWLPLRIDRTALASAKRFKGE